MTPSGMLVGLHLAAETDASHVCSCVGGAASPFGFFTWATTANVNVSGTTTTTTVNGTTTTTNGTSATTTNVLATSFKRIQNDEDDDVSTASEGIGDGRQAHAGLRRRSVSHVVVVVCCVGQARVHV